MPNNTRSALLRDEAPTAHVRVRPGWALRAYDDHAPSIPKFYESGAEIPDFDAVEAAYWVAAGALEEVV